jgi:hypothetical protein
LPITFIDSGISIDFMIVLLSNAPSIEVANGKYTFQSARVITSFLSKPTDSRTALVTTVASLGPKTHLIESH